MNKKLRRILQPGMVLFFVVLLLFSGAAFALKEYYLGLEELAVTLILFLSRRLKNSSNRRQLAEYVQDHNEMLHRTENADVPFPLALVQLTTGRLAWYNQAFRELTQVRDSLDAPVVDELLPGLKLDWLKSGGSEGPADLHVGKHRFRVKGSLLEEENLAMLYLQDVTDLLQVRDEYIRSRPVLAVILIDNYNELTNSLSDTAVSLLNAELHAKISEWADMYNGLLRNLERNRYLLMLEAKDLADMTEHKFELLDSIRSVNNSNGIAATVSIGVGKDGVDFRENYSFATLSIEMALSRGGDQAVIKDRHDFSFFGGRIRTGDRSDKVQSRTISSTLSQLILQSEQVFVMGHKMADLDALGAAVGICCLCRKLGKEAHIVIDMEQNASQALLSKLKDNPNYRNCFLSGQDALVDADSKSLLVVVDTNRPDQVECKPLLESIRSVVVIDHHRRAADYIEKTALSLHDTRASSASELVTELLQYTVEPEDISPIEAEALLAGLALDTKNFTVRTNSRTFEAAAFLRSLGVDTVEVKKLFQNDLRTTVARYKIIQAARMYQNNIAICALDYTVTRALAAQAADELLNITGIEVSFVLYPQDNQTIISARSISKTNVQIILEALGGGGNGATAGAQVRNKTVNETLDLLLQSINKYFEP